MMIGCLILYHKTVTSLTKSMLLRAVFHEEDFEIEVLDESTVVLYVWNVERRHVWQAVLDFELASVHAGYGFGNYKWEAEERAHAVLVYSQGYQQHSGDICGSLTGLSTKSTIE